MNQIILHLVLSKDANKKLSKPMRNNLSNIMGEGKIASLPASA